MGPRYGEFVILNLISNILKDFHIYGNFEEFCFITQIAQNKIEPDTSIDFQDIHRFRIIEMTNLPYLSHLLLAILF